MKLFILSDIHYDFYLKSYHGNMERFFEQRFLPADTIVIAGDIANNFSGTELFLKEISQRYKNVVLCLGNHDLTITWENGRFKTSEEKIDALQKLCNSFPNIHMLEGRTETIDGVKFGGCMGMWDMSFILDYGLDNKYSEMKFYWNDLWFDGVHWNYFNQDLDKIKEAEFAKLQKVLSEKPDVMLTHFAPLPKEQFMPPLYRKDYVSTFFYFDDRIAKKYLTDNTNAIWCSGHTHTAFKEDRIYVHPNGYPEEHARIFNKLHRKDFLVEV